ncbi:MAG: phospholipase D-like domain-containing protein, partial [Planctomycetota bacterium]
MTFETWWATLFISVEFLLQLLVVTRVIMRGARRSATSLAWIVVVLFLPIAGMVAWFLIGEARIGSRRRRRYAELAERIVTFAKSLGPMEDHRSDPPGYEVAIALAEAVGGTPPRGGHTLELMGDTKQVIDSLVVDIDAAQETCNLLFYIYLDDGSGRQVAQALKGAARRGVQCRLLVDDVGSKKFLKSRLCESLREAGVRVVGALPAHLLRAAFARIDLRNHRKLAIIDGVIGYTGSQNIADASFAPKPMFAPWVDCMLRIQGPVVWDLQTIFVCDWFLDTGEPIESLLTKDTGEVDDGVTVQILPTGPANDN